MKNIFKEFQQLVKNEEFDRALMELNILEKNNALPANILVTKGICIQLGSEHIPYNLQDAEMAFKTALEIDDEYIDALIELGCYYNSCEGNAEKALPYFKKACELASSQITEVIQRLAECISETKSPREALDFIDEAVRSTVNEQNINDTVTELKKLM